MRWWCSIVAMVAMVTIVGLAGTAGAHPLQMGALKLDTDPAATGSITIALELDVGAVAAVLKRDEKDLDAATVRGLATDLAAATYRLQPIPECRWGTATAELHRRVVAVADSVTCSPDVHELRWSLPFVPRVAPTFQLLVRARVFGTERVTIVDKATSVFEVSGTETVGKAATLADFVWKGVEHIGVAPSQWHDAAGFKLPDGIDHICFVIALGLVLVLARDNRWGVRGPRDVARSALVLVTAFSLAHAIALVLGAVFEIALPSALIGPLLGVTVLYVAAEDIADPGVRWRPALAFAFGVVHGLGSSPALHGTAPLTAFVVGVELAQIAILACVLPLCWLLARRGAERYRRRVLPVAAAVLAAVALWSA